MKKVKILLISPPFQYFPGNRYGQALLNYTRPPLGMCYLASYLSRHLGHRVNINLIDGMLYSEKKILTKAQEFRPDVIGISAVTANINKGKSIVKQIRLFLPESLYIGGGPHLSVRPQDGFPDFDAIAVGEGEKSFFLIISQWMDGIPLENISIPGVVICHNADFNTMPVTRINDLDELPFPDRSLLEIDKYYHSYPYKTITRRFTTIFTSRGCNFNCSFCGSRIIFPGGKRYFSLPYVMEEIAQVVDYHKCSLVFFDDDEFMMGKERLINLCEHLIKKHYPLKWICHGRPEASDPEIMKLMKRAGCVEIQVGVESGSEYLLNKMGRHYSLDQVCKFFNAAKNAKLNTWATFIIGYPGETEKTVESTLQLAINADPTYASFITLLPFPGTAIFSELVEQNRIKTYDWSLYSWHSNDPVYVSQYMSSTQLIEKRAELLRKFYLRPKKIFSMGKDVFAAGHATEMTRNFLSWLSLAIRTNNKGFK